MPMQMCLSEAGQAGCISFGVMEGGITVGLMLCVMKPLFGHYGQSDQPQVGLTSTSLEGEARSHKMLWGRKSVPSMSTLRNSVLLFIKMTEIVLIYPTRTFVQRRS